MVPALQLWHLHGAILRMVVSTAFFIASTNTVFSRSEVLRVRAIFLPHSVLWRRNVLADKLEPLVPAAQRALTLLGQALQMEPDAILTPKEYLFNLHGKSPNEFYSLHGHWSDSP